MRALRKFALLAALFGATVLGGCMSAENKEGKKPMEAAKETLEKPVESFVIKKGDAGYDTLYEAFKADIEAKVADEAKRAEVVFEVDGKTANAYFEKNNTARFQTGVDEVVFDAPKPYGVENVLKVARKDLQAQIEEYDGVVKKMYSDSKISVEEKTTLDKYLKATLHALRSKKNNDEVSQIVLRGLLKEVYAQIEHYANNGMKEYFMACGLVDGKDVGLTGNPQKVDLPEDQVKALLSAGGSETYKRLQDQAKSHGLNKYAAVPQKGGMGRGKELSKARGQWIDCTLAEFKALTDTNKVGLDNPGTRLSKDAVVGLTNGKYEDREIRPGKYFVQVVVSGAKADANVAAAAKYGGKVVGE